MKFCSCNTELQEAVWLFLCSAGDCILLPLTFQILHKVISFSIHFPCLFCVCFSFFFFLLKISFLVHGFSFQTCSCSSTSIFIPDFLTASIVSTPLFSLIILVRSWVLGFFVLYPSRSQVWHPCSTPLSTLECWSHSSSLDFGFSQVSFTFVLPEFS